MILPTIVCAIGVQIPFLPASIQAVINQNRGALVVAGMMLFMVGNALQQTGAFEVYVGETRVFSKLETGRVPSFEEMKEIILMNTILRQEG